MSDSVAIVGSGLIGRAWAIAFGRAGWQVRLWDPDSSAPEAALVTIDSLLADLAAQDMLNGVAATDVLAHMLAVPTLDEALAGADWVQENAPEDLEIKRALWLDIDRLADSGTLLASSTSAIVPSKFTESLANRAHCFNCHPINPPYLIPAVELVPAPWTSPGSWSRAEEVIRGIGQAVDLQPQRPLDLEILGRVLLHPIDTRQRLLEDRHRQHAAEHVRGSGAV